MDTLSPENHAATKVLVKACNWADRRRAVLNSPEEEKARQIGRLTKSVVELDEAVAQYRKAGGQP